MKKKDITKMDVEEVAELINNKCNQLALEAEIDEDECLWGCKVLAMARYLAVRGMTVEINALKEPENYGAAMRVILLLVGYSYDIVQKSDHQLYFEDIGIRINISTFGALYISKAN